MANGKITKRTLDSLLANDVAGDLRDDDLKGFDLGTGSAGAVSCRSISDGRSWVDERRSRSLPTDRPGTRSPREPKLNDFSGWSQQVWTRLPPIMDSPGNGRPGVFEICGSFRDGLYEQGLDDARDPFAAIAREAGASRQAAAEDRAARYPHRISKNR